MKKYLLTSLLLSALCLLGGCAEGEAFIVETDPNVYEETVLGGETVAGKTYIFESGGFGGEFSLSLRADGSMQYYEGMLSSHIGNGTWTQEGDLLTIRERDGQGGERVNCFRVTRDSLVFVAEKSDNFIYKKLSSGDRFFFDSLN